MKIEILQKVSIPVEILEKYCQSLKSKDALNPQQPKPKQSLHRCLWKNTDFIHRAHEILITTKGLALMGNSVKLSSF
jgi:hypothetical protein